MEEQRIEVLEPPYPREIENDFKTIMPEGMPQLNIFPTVAHNPRVLHRIGHVDRPLSFRQLYRKYGPDCQ